MTDDIRECYMWLQKNRSVLINYIRAACQFHRMENQENKSLLYEQIFSSKVTFLDGILTWLRDVLGRMAPDGSYRSSLRLNARCAIGLLIQLYLTGIEKIGNVKTMEDVMKACCYIRFDFGDTVPVIKPHTERLDEVPLTESHAHQVVPLKSHGEPCQEVEELRQQVADIQASLDRITNQHQECDIKDDEHARKIKEIQWIILLTLQKRTALGE